MFATLIAFLKDRDKMLNMTCIIHSLHLDTSQGMMEMKSSIIPCEVSSFKKVRMMKSFAFCIFFSQVFIKS